MKTAYNVGDGGTQIVQRINKRDLLRRIEALEAEVRALQARPNRMSVADLKDTGDFVRRFPVTAAQALPHDWQFARVGGQALPIPGYNTRLEN